MHKMVALTLAKKKTPYIVPWQCLLSEWSSKPTLQAQSYPPSVFIQNCSQPWFTEVHSSYSVKKKKLIHNM